MQIGHMTVQSVSQSVERHGLKVLVYGASGAGKTRLAATAPTPFIISAESGLLSLSKTAPNIPCVAIKSLKDLWTVHSWISGSTEAKQFQTFCLDSISEIAEQCLKEELGLSKDGRKAYGNMSDRVLTAVKAYRDIQGPNIYFSCKEEYNVVEGGGGSFDPSMPGKQTATQLPYLFDYSLRLIKWKEAANGQTVSALCCADGVNYKAKDRSGTLEEYEEPNLTKIFAKVSS